MTNLSDILARILTDQPLRHKHREYGVCYLVELLADGLPNEAAILDQFRTARCACTQTGSAVYPVTHPTLGRGDGYGLANDNKTMWRGEYGRNRRKLVRDCLRWAREKGL